MTVYKDKTLTGISESLDHLLEVCQEYAHSRQAPSKLRTDKYGDIIFDQDMGLPCDVFTNSEEIKNNAFVNGFWVQEWGIHGLAKWQIHFGWTRNYLKPPNNSAMHCKTVITSDLAAKLWGIEVHQIKTAIEKGKFSKQFAEGLLWMSAGAWLITEQAMKEVFGDPKAKNT
jgi:hypothetical protein